MVCGNAKTISDNIIDILSSRASSEALAYVFLADGTSDTEIRWTFADTARKSAAFAAHLADCGITSGDRVVLAVNPGLEYIAAMFAVLRLGAVPVPCFPPLRPKELERFRAITVDCSPVAIVINEMYRRPIEILCGQLTSVAIEPTVLYVEQATFDGAYVENAACASDDVALIQYTSGSTGSPKGVCLTHDNIASNCQALGRSMGDDPDRVGLSWLPPYHDMGLLGTIILSMYHGWPLVLMSPLHFVQEPRRWLRAITDYRVTITAGPNFSLDLCADSVRWGDDDGLDLSSLRELYCGAEPIRADTLDRFETCCAPIGLDGVALIPCYGMAEATLFVSGKRAGSRHRTAHVPQPDRGGRTVVSCGEVDPEHRVRIVDTLSGTAVADGEVGEIWVSGRSVAAGYHNREQLTRNVFHARVAGDEGRYLRTGDLGFLRSGELFVTGRSKDLIIVDGRNIHPQDVEAAAVRADPAVRVAVAFGVAGDGPERLVVVAETREIVSAQRHSALIERIRADVTAEFGVGPDVHLSHTRTVPTTTSGKVQRHEAKRMFLADGFAGVQPEARTTRGCPA